MYERSARDPESNASLHARVVGRAVKIRRCDERGDDLPVEKEPIDGEPQGKAVVDRVMEERLAAGWVEVGGASAAPKESPPAPRGLPSTFTVPDSSASRLQERGALEAFNGRRSPQTAIRLPLEFGRPEELRPTLAGLPHLQDWLVHHAWPSELIPLALLGVDDEEDEALLEEANPSDSDQFFAVHVGPPHPVSLWSADAGFEELWPTLEAFLATLED